MRAEPAPGRAVVFTAGRENLHGIEAISGRGSRCSLLLWFTRDRERAAHGSEVSAAKALLAEHEGRGRALYE